MDGQEEQRTVKQMGGGDWIADQLARADQQARTFVVEHPILALACAVGVGYLAARLLRGTK